MTIEMLPTQKIISAEFAATQRRYLRAGMQIKLVGQIGRPENLRALLQLEKSDFGICGFMGSSPGRVAGMKEIARAIPEMLGKIDADYDLRIPLISGGGNWPGIKPDESTGLMGEWAYGATRNGRFARFVITQGLMGKEGVPHSEGITVCLKQMLDSDDPRLGLRTDGLLNAGDVFPVLTGGNGTVVEVRTMFTNFGINPNFRKKRGLFIDPIFQNPRTTSAAPFWEKQIEAAMAEHDAGLISDATAKIINDNCLVYRPDASLSPLQVSREATAILLAIRADAPNYHPEAEYQPVPPDLLRKFACPLSQNSTIGHIFDQHPLTDRSWGDYLQHLSAGCRKNPIMQQAPAA